MKTAGRRHLPATADGRDELPPAQRLRRGAAALALRLPEGAPDRLLAFAALLAKWNRVYNLTALRQERDVIDRHLLDSLAVLPLLGTVERLADIGSGGGLPGIPLAIARPEMALTLVEASQKKAAFLQQARIELGLANVTVHCGRVEHWRPPAPFAAVISRAFASLADFVAAAGHLVGEGGALLAMKGAYPQEELARLPAGWRAVEVRPLRVPGVAGARHLVRLIRE